MVVETFAVVFVVVKGSLEVAAADTAIDVVAIDKVVVSALP